MANYKDIFAAIEDESGNSGMNKEQFEKEYETYDDGRVIFDGWE